MKQQWQALSAKFAALQQREKVMVAVAVVAVTGLGGQTLWVDPAMARVSALKKQLAQQQADMGTLQVQLVTMQAQIKDPDAGNKARLAEIRRQLAATDENLKHFDQTLVSPERAPQLLQSLLARHRGLELVALQTVPAVPLLVAKADETSGTKAPDAKPAAPAAPVGGMIYKHGIEIKVAGGYNDLLSYVTELERLPQKLLLGNMTLTVTGYPRSELALTVFSLSLDSIWLVV
jgi:MSHA biogenesis protein MshJ